MILWLTDVLFSELICYSSFHLLKAIRKGLQRFTEMSKSKTSSKLQQGSRWNIQDSKARFQHVFTLYHNMFCNVQSNSMFKVSPWILF